MYEITVVDPNTAIAKFWYLFSYIVHFLQVLPDEVKICGQAEYVLTVKYPTHSSVVLRATVPVVDDRGYSSYVANLLKCEDQFAAHGAMLTVWTRELGTGKVWRQVTHGKITPDSLPPTAPTE